MRWSRWSAAVVLAVLVAASPVKGEDEEPLAQASRFLSEGRYSEAQAIYLELAQRAGADETAAQATWMAAFNYQANLRQLERASEWYDRFLARWPDHPRAGVARGERERIRELLADSLELQEAIRGVRAETDLERLPPRLAELARQIETHPDSVLLGEAYDALASGWYALERWEEALAAYREARGRLPEVHREYLDDRIAYVEREIARERMARGAAWIAALAVLASLGLAPWRAMSRRRAAVAAIAVVSWLALGGVAALASSWLGLADEDAVALEPGQVFSFALYALLPLGTAILLGLGTADRPRWTAGLVPLGALLQTACATFLWCDSLRILYFFEASHETLSDILAG